MFFRFLGLVSRAALATAELVSAIGHGNLGVAKGWASRAMQYTYFSVLGILFTDSQSG